MQNQSHAYFCGPPRSHQDRYEPQRFMAATRFPTLNLSNGTLEWGISCNGCRDGPPNDDRSREWAKMYTKCGYLAHFDQFKWRRDLLETCWRV